MTNTPLVSTNTQPAALPDMFSRYRADLGAAMRRQVSSDRVGVYDLLRYYLGWVDKDGNPASATEGKALRPTLCLFACEATGGSVGQALPAAVALELIHSFSLIHDDIQDRDETRHHRSTLWAEWGVPKALVAGNVLRIVADMSLNGPGERHMDPEHMLGVVNLLTEAYLEMIEGQYLDISYEGRRDIGMGDYLNMIARKTGALIRCSLNLGAMIGTRDTATVEAFRDFGRSLGYVFQIRDDLLGVWGDEESTGKPVGADIIRKKNSLPVVYAMSVASGSDKQLLDEAYGRDELNDEDVSMALEVMDKVHTKEYAHRIAVDHCDAAMRALSAVELEPEFRQQAEELIHFLLVRQH